MKVISKNTKRVLRLIRKYLMITLGALIYAIAISLFLDPNNIAPGGVTGVSILLNRLSGIPTGTLNMLINIPIVLLGLWKFGWRFICSTLYALVLITVFINHLSIYNAITNDLLISAVLGGALIGVSLAIVFKYGATTGGSDIIVKVLRLRWKHIKTNIIFLCVDVLVICASWVVFKDMTVAFYAGLAVVINSVVMDYFLYGGDEAKLIYIISDYPEKMKERIMEELDLTATLIPAKGAYTNNDKEIIMIVVRKQIAPKVEEIVKDEDHNSFMIVSSASEIFGEGYKDIKSEKI